MQGPQRGFTLPLRPAGQAEQLLISGDAEVGMVLPSASRLGIAPCPLAAALGAYESNICARLFFWLLVTTAPALWQRALKT